MDDDQRTLLLGAPSGGLTRLAATDARLEVVEDLERCLAELGSDTGAVALVVIAPGWPRPLSAVRAIRQQDATVALAVGADADEVATVRAKLAFLPDAGAVDVVAVDVEPARLAAALDDAATVSWQRRRVRSALDAINRDLTRGSADRSATATVSEHYLAALVQHAADTIVSTDPECRLVTVNAAGRRTLGLDPATAEGRPLQELLAGDDPGELTALLSAAARQGPQVADELTVRLPAGQHLVLSATTAPVRDGLGTVAGLVLIARDVTAERQTEERLRALQKAESLATLASGVAHDFNNLLVQAQGWAELAGDDPDDTELVATALGHIGQATRRASELARAMLAYGGRGRFEPRQLRLAALVDDLRPLLAASVPRKIHLELDLARDPATHADPTQLRQVLMNLVTNAAEAIGEESGTIHIHTDTATVAPEDATGEAAPPLPGGRYAVIEVRDTGPGIDPLLRDRLFDPFFTTKFTGRGLGLAASQGITRAHGGVITVDSTPGRGARFRVHLPATPEDDDVR